ncbi:MAG: SCP2 sterol-binding domain-containing protein [Candidatus Lokiarchaeota archaeon]|nr:SCP2 sterol-binding domain-containing protein [Candidatus Lokiarchaeota archaeon]
MPQLYMLDSRNFRSVLHELENNDEEFISVLDRVISFAVNIIKNTEELREEIIDYDDIYQILLTDINFNFWIKLSNGSITYKKGINRNATLRVRYTKDIFIKILKREMGGVDAFIKGKIKVDGDWGKGLRFIKIFRLFFKYIENGKKKK